MKKYNTKKKLEEINGFEILGRFIISAVCMRWIYDFGKQWPDGMMFFWIFLCPLLIYCLLPYLEAQDKK